MHKEFLELYNRELALLYEHAKEFSEEYPGIAERLGGLARERADPMIIGLLEGTALLAARVQLKLKHEFPEFTNNLIEQLLPNFLAPLPSAMLAQVKPTFGDPGLREGRVIKKGAPIDAVYRERERNIACRYTLSSDLTYWPFDLTKAEYHATPGPLQAMHLNVDQSVAAGLRLTLRLRTTPRMEDEPAEDAPIEDPLGLFAGCPIDVLPIYFVGAESEAVAIYEQIFAHLNGVCVRYLDSFGDPQVVRLNNVRVEQIGFGDDETLFPYDNRIFQGFALLQEYFVFPQKFMGVRLAGLRDYLSKIQARSIDIIFLFNDSLPRLSAAANLSMFALYAAPAINLFRKNTDRIPIKPGTHEYHVVPDRSQYLSYEPHRALDVFAHYPGRQEKVRVMPLYSAPVHGERSKDQLYYTVRRLTRKRSTDERRFGVSGDYIGTDMFISVTAPEHLNDDQGVLELSLRAMCSNRHLTEHLPVGQGGADFRLRDDTSLDIRCAAGPTRPRESLIALRHDQVEHLGLGTTSWRLINMLSLNHLGLVRNDGEALREILAMFADMSDSATERRIRGVRTIASRAVVRRFAQRTGVGVGRGLEITVTLEEKAFEGSGVFLLGAVLDRFFAEYAALNHFTTTVIRTIERGTIARWPPRAGSRTPL